MQRLATILVDLTVGLLFVAIAFAGARVFLQDRALVYLFFPLLCSAALAVGLWRGGRSQLPWPAIAGLTTAPLLLVALQYFSGRNKPFMVLPVVTFVFVAIGVVLARSRPAARVVVAVTVAMNVIASFAGPAYVGLITTRSDAVEAARPYTVRLVDGRVLDSRVLTGRIVVLDFWATWCVPCRYELPVIQRAFESFRNDPEVVFVAVDGVMTDSPGDTGDTAARAAEYFRRAGYSLPLAWDDGGRLEKAFQLHGFPTLLILDRHGRVRMRHVGFIGSEHLETLIRNKVEALRTEPHSSPHVQ